MSPPRGAVADPVDFVLDHGADRGGNISSTVDTVISRHIGVDSIVHFNYKGRTSPGVVDSDLTAVPVARSEQSRAGYSAFETRGKTHQNSAVDRF